MLMFRMQHAIQKMYGIQHSGEKTMLYCAEMLTYTWLMLLVGCLLSLVGDMGIGGMVGGSRSVQRYLCALQRPQYKGAAKRPGYSYGTA
ncbi:hypothetical protein Q0F98_25540 [Paenibacillus amylolyticus]|nr:hypothetical protein Q0F98_25540 [Paenibacillus amylolyticus]